MSYDPQCDELARSFLSDIGPIREIEVSTLAQVIQDAIEDEIGDIQFRRNAEDAEPQFNDQDRDEWRHEAAEAQRLK